MPATGVLPAEKTKLAGRGRGVGREEEAHSPPGLEVAGKTDGEWGACDRGAPRRRNEACWLRTGSGTRETSSLPAWFRKWLGKPTGSGVPPAGGLPVEKMKLVGRGRGVGREKEAHSPPGLMMSSRAEVMEGGTAMSNEN